LRRQADQIGTCIQQAEQYFSASTQVDLTVKPNLLYYGMVALARALVLLKNNGLHSLDSLRKKGEHITHGLVLNYGMFEDTKTTATIKEITDSIQCRIKRSGTFPLFWKSCTSSSFCVEKTTRDQIRGVSLSESISKATEPKTDLIGERIDESISLTTLLCGLPCIYYDLEDCNIAPSINPGKAWVHVDTPFAIRADVGGVQNMSPSIYQVYEQHCFSIDHLDARSQTQLMENLRIINPELKMDFNLGATSDNSIIVKYKITHHCNATEELGSYPCIIQDMHGNFFYIVDPLNHILEAAALFMVMYCLGMTCRYMPDKWVPLILGNNQFREFLDSSLLGSTTIRFPYLLLNQMMNSHHNIHM
jgi:hypothetical protein